MPKSCSRLQSCLKSGALLILTAYLHGSQTRAESTDRQSAIPPSHKAAMSSGQYVTITTGANYLFLPNSAKEHFNEAPGAYFGLLSAYKNFGLQGSFSFAWPRSKAAFQSDGKSWPEYSTVLLTDISAALGYTIWIFEQFHVTPTIGVGVTQVSLLSQQDTIKQGVLNIPMALNFVYQFQTSGTEIGISTWPRLVYSLFARASYAYPTNNSTGAYFDSGIWQATVGVGCSFLKRAE